MDILEMLAKSGSLSQLSKQYGMSEDVIAQAIKMGLPQIAGQISKNTSSDQGMLDFMNAINDHKDDDVESMVRDVNRIDMNDGAKILGHIFGNKEQDIALDISKKTGAQSMDIMKILSMLAPILMGSLGKQAKNKRMTDNDGLESTLESMLGGRSGLGGMLAGFLDKDKDGSMIDDLIGGMFKG